MIQHVSTSQIEELLSIGCNVKVNSKRKSSSSLERFAAIARNSGANLEIVINAPISSSTLRRIAAIGRSNVSINYAYESN